VDNLGFFGWNEFHAKAGSVSFLGWPLHALGDATVPMHVAGTTAWGHRPFENAQENNWRFIARMLGLGNGTAVLHPEHPKLLARAVRWRQQILNWRSKGHGLDVPVRDLVTDLAGNTFKYSMEKQTQLTDWPFDDAASTLFFTSAFKDAAVSKYENYPHGVELVMPMIEDGVAAKAAFLISAMEVVQ
jgi:hypothetical protein